MNRLSSITARAGLCVAGLAATVVAALATSAAAAGSGVPYTDPAAAGSIGLCDAHAHPVTSGSIAQQPFAFTAVSSAAAPKGYDVPMAKATLFAYQPRPDVAASEWSGRQLTAPSTFTNKAHPMAAFTTADEPLLTFVQAFPPRVQGLVELRLYLSAPNEPLNNMSYAVANIRVQGNQWTQVAPTRGACGSGKATSIESTNLPASAFGARAAVHPNSKAGQGVAGGSTAGGHQASGQSTGSTPTASRSSSSGGNGVLFGALAAVAAALGAVAVFVRRQRRRAFSDSAQAPTPDLTYPDTRTRV